jgi:hypothetical protein
MGNGEWGIGHPASGIRHFVTRYQALPGNVDPEALPPNFIKACEAEPLDIRSQALPGNESSLPHARCPMPNAPFPL